MQSSNTLPQPTLPPTTTPSPNPPSSHPSRTSPLSLPKFTGSAPPRPSSPSSSRRSNSGDTVNLPHKPPSQNSNLFLLRRSHDVQTVRWNGMLGLDGS